MLVRNLMRALRNDRLPYGNSTKRYLFSEQADGQTSNAEGQTNKQETNQQNDAVKKRPFKLKNSTKRFLNSLPQELDESPPLVNEYIFFDPKFKLTQKMVKFLEKFEDPKKKIQVVAKLKQRHREMVEENLVKYQSNLKLSLNTLYHSNFLDNSDVFVTHRLGNQAQRESATLKLSRLGSFDLVDEEIVHSFFENNKIDKIKQLYKSGFFFETHFDFSGYNLLLTKTLNNQSNGFYVNLIYETYRRNVYEQTSGCPFYFQLPIKKADLKLLSDKINNNELPQANPLKFYWTVIHSEPKSFRNYGEYMVLLMRKLLVNNRNAQNYIASLSNLFINQSITTQLFYHIFTLNITLQKVISSWSVVLILLSRIQSILSKGQPVQMVNFNDLFNLLREMNQGHYYFIKQACPKILYEKCSPEIFMVYQKALQYYNNKNKTKRVRFYQISKLQKLWGLQGQTHYGFKVQFFHEFDQLPIHDQVEQVIQNKDYHQYDSSSEKIIQKIQACNQELTDELQQMTEIVWVSKYFENSQEFKQAQEQLIKDQEIIKSAKLRTQEPKQRKKIEKIKLETIFKNLESSIVRETIKTNYVKTLDYLRLLIAEDVDQNPKELQTYLVKAYADSRRLGFKSGSQEEALYVIKQIQKKWIYLEKPDIKLNSQLLYLPFSEFYTKSKDIKLESQIQQLEQQMGITFQNNQEDQEDQADDVEQQIFGQKLFKDEKNNDAEGLQKKKRRRKINKQEQKLDDIWEDDEEGDFEELENKVDVREQKPKNLNGKKQVPKKQGLFSKLNKNQFSTSKEIQYQQPDDSESYSNYLKHSKQIQNQIQVLSFDFNNCKNFSQISAQFIKSIEKINEHNIEPVLKKFDNIPIVGNISILIQYNFLKIKSNSNKIPTGLKINFETSLGMIQKDYGMYLTDSAFMFEFPEKLYKDMLEAQKNKFNRKEFKKIVAHYILFKKNMNVNIIKLICEICSKQKMGVTLLEILELLNTRKIKSQYEGVKIMSAGVQKYRNLETDLLSFLKKYCDLCEYDLETKIFQPYIENLVQTEDYEKLNTFFQLLRFELKPKQYRLNKNLSSNQNVEAERAFKMKEQLRFRSQNFNMLEIVAHNLKEKTEIPPFLVQLFDEFASKATQPLNSKQLGVGLLIYCQNQQKIALLLQKIQSAGANNDIFVFECGLKVLKLFGRRMSKILENILATTLYLNKIQLTPNQAHQLGEIFKELDMPNAYNKYLQYFLRYQPQVNPETKRLYYLIFNRTTDQYSKNQMNSLLDMLFNENKHKERIEFKKIRQEEEKKADYLNSLLKKNVEIQVKQNPQGHQIDSLTINEAIGKKDVVAKQSNKNKSKDKKNISVESSKTSKKEATTTNADNQFVYTNNLTKKQKRNKPLMNFLSVFMKKYEKTEEEDPKQPATTKGGKDKDKQSTAKGKSKK